MDFKKNSLGLYRPNQIAGLRHIRPNHSKQPVHTILGAGDGTSAYKPPSVSEYDRTISPDSEK